MRSNPPLFELNNYHDLYKKAEHDLIRLREKLNSYDLFNYICTINHLPEWITKDQSISIPPSQIPDNTQKNSPLYIVRMLCNRTKHFKKLKNSPNTETQTGFGRGGYGKGEYNTGEPSYIVQIGSDNHDVIEICEQAFKIWKTFLQKHNLI